MPALSLEIERLGRCSLASLSGGGDLRAAAVPAVP